MTYLGQYPVLSITLKQVCGDTISEAKTNLWEQIREAADRFSFLCENGIERIVYNYIKLKRTPKQYCLKLFYEEGQGNIARNHFEFLRVWRETAVPPTLGKETVDEHR